MAELEWFDGYSGETTAELLSLDGKYRTDSLVVALEDALWQKADEVGQENLTDEEQLVLAVEALEREVNNGGYHQFFINSSRDFAPIVVSCLEQIGCAKTAEITREAVDVERQDPITEQEIEDGSSYDNAARMEAFERCDTRYFESGEDIATRLFEFVKSNRDRIKL